MSNLGYDVDTNNRTFEHEGITGEVTRYVTEKMEFPCYILINDPNNPVEMHKIKVLPSMFDSSTGLGNTGTANAISIYYRDGGKTLKLGKIAPRQVRAFLRLFMTNSVVGMLNKDKELTGDYLYVLAD